MVCILYRKIKTGLEFDFNAEIRNCIEYFYSIIFKFNADLQLSAEILFTSSYLELCSSRKHAYIILTP